MSSAIESSRRSRRSGPARAAAAASVSVVSVHTARTDWERAFGELEAQKGDPRRCARLRDAADAVTAELRARIGQTFTLDELVTEYADVDRWGRHAVAERAPYE